MFAKANALALVVVNKFSADFSRIDLMATANMRCNFSAFKEQVRFVKIRTVKMSIGGPFK